jgi:hypothetical protein
MAKWRSPTVHVVRESHGHEVLTADDGSRGFASAQLQGPDAIDWI